MVQLGLARFLGGSLKGLIEAKKSKKLQRMSGRVCVCVRGREGGDAGGGAEFGGEHFHHRCLVLNSVEDQVNSDYVKEHCGEQVSESCQSAVTVDVGGWWGGGGGALVVLE